MSLTDEQYEELKTQLVSSLAREYEYRRLLFWPPETIVEAVMQGE